MRGRGGGGVRGRRVDGGVRGRRVDGGVRGRRVEVEVGGVVAHCTFSAASTFSGGRISIVSNSSSSWLSMAVSMDRELTHTHTQLLGGMVDGGGGVMLT